MKLSAPLHTTTSTTPLHTIKFTTPLHNINTIDTINFTLPMPT
jgi:hypothetical protein